MATTPSPSELFWTFSRLSLKGFGGVLPWAYQEIVEKKKWLSSQEFAELLAVGQIVPGANITNVSVMLGYRFGGVRGALAAVTGLLGFPFVIIVILGILYQRFGSIPAVHSALHGVTAVVAGLVLVTGFKLLQGQPRSWRLFVFALLALLGVGVFQWPLLYVVLVLAPLSLFAEARALK